MKKLLFLLILGMSLSSCGVKKNLNPSHNNPSKKAQKVVDFAMGYLGTSYKYGGTTKRGMDCSGLVYMSFLNVADLHLPRRSSAMAKKGKRLLRKEIRLGDLVFFRTNKNRQTINHVGLVVEHKKGSIHFIHSTTHKGVMISTLNQPYWKRTFVEARRVLPPL